jgi:hypothetical protein
MRKRVHPASVLLERALEDIPPSHVWFTAQCLETGLQGGDCSCNRHHSYATDEVDGVVIEGALSDLDRCCEGGSHVIAHDLAPRRRRR